MKNLKQTIKEEYQKILQEQEERPKTLKIRKVSGNFLCFNNNLKSLEGAPKEVGGRFLCHNNRKRFTEEEVRSVSDVDGGIKV